MGTFNFVPDVDNASSCGMCMSMGWTWCTNTDDVFPYAVVETGEAVPNVTEECEDPLDDPVNINNNSWVCTNVLDPAVAIHMCMFVEDECSLDREYSKTLGDASSIITINNMGAEASCSYKVKAQSGAPGFNLDMTQFSSSMYSEFVSLGSRPEVEGSAV